MKKAKDKQVKQHNLITQARYDMSAMEMDIVFLLLSKLDDERKSRRIYEINIGELEERSGKSINVTHLKEATSRLRAREYMIEEADGSYLQVGILASVKYTRQKRLLELELSMRMEEFLFDLRNNFTVYYLEVALRLKSKYAKRIYQLLSQFRSTGYYRTSILKLKEQLGLYDPKHPDRESYTEVSTFKSKVLEVAQRELANSDVAFEYEFIKEGRKFQWIDFHFQSKPAPEKVVNITPLQEQPADLPVEKRKRKQEATSLHTFEGKLMHPEETGQDGTRLLFDRMTQDFSLSPRQIEIIFRHFSREQINRTLYDLKLEIADKQVKNKGAYTAKRFESMRSDLKISQEF